MTYTSKTLCMNKKNRQDDFKLLSQTICSNRIRFTRNLTNLFYLHVYVTFFSEYSNQDFCYVEKKQQHNLSL